MKRAEILEIHEGESRGQQVMLFNDYIQRLAAVSKDATEAVSQIPLFKKLGITLFKLGFTYDNAEFVDLCKDGGVMTFNFPSVDDFDFIESGSIEILFYDFVDGRKWSYFKTRRVKELSNLSGELLIKDIRAKAFPEK